MYHWVQLSDVPEDAPVFDGTDVPLQYLFDYLDARYSLYSFLRDFPQVRAEQAIEAIRGRARAEIPAESVRGRVSGTPVFTGSRIPIQGLFEYLAHGESIEDYLENYPTAGRDQVVRAVELASILLEATAYENAVTAPGASS